MSFYHDWIVPHLVNMSMRQENLIPYRRRAIGNAKGRVLEIGVGSGLNFSLYGETVTQVIGLDPSPKLLSMAKSAVLDALRPIDLLEGSAEAIPG